MSNNKPRVIIVCARSKEDLEKRILKVKPYMGLKRFESLPFFDDIDEAWYWMRANINKEVQIDYTVAKSCGLVD